MGFRPYEYDLLDPAKENYIKRAFSNNKPLQRLYIGNAIKKMQQMPFGISNDLNYIDLKNRESNARRKISEKRWFKLSIADQISLARNAMLHGEQHSFYSMGNFLIVMYILFHLNEVKERECS